MNKVQFSDLLTHKSTWEAYIRLRQVANLPPVELHAYQRAKLRSLLTHCVSSVPFYKHVLAGSGANLTVDDPFEILSLFPVVDKSTLRENYDGFLAEGSAKKFRTKMAQTGGTTGAPLKFLKDSECRSAINAAVLRAFEGYGVSQNDRKLIVWGKRIAGSNLKERARLMVQMSLDNSRYVDAFRVSQNSFESLKRIFERFQPRMVYGYCQATFEIARLFMKNHYSYPLKAVVTTVEPLFPHHRQMFKYVFGCDTYDQYGSVEVSAIGFECIMHEGLHVTEERCVVEAGKDGVIILTDLDNKVFPFVRYMNGDVIELDPKPCLCGLNSKRIKKLLGRVGDVIIGLNGNRLHPEFFTHLLNETGISYRRNLLKYQVFQLSERRLEWRIVSDNLDEDETAILLAQLQRYLGEMDFVITNVPDISVGRSGKFQYVCSNVTS